MGKIIIGTGVVVVILIMYIIHLSGEIEKKDLIVKAQVGVINAQADSAKVIEQLDKERKEFEQKLDEERKAMYIEMRRVLSNDKKAATWAATPIPDSVLRLRETGSARTGSDSSPKRPAGANPHPQDAGQHQP